MLLVIAVLAALVISYAIYKTRRYRTEIKRVLEEKKEEKEAARAGSEPPDEDGEPVAASDE